MGKYCGPLQVFEGESFALEEKLIFTVLHMASTDREVVRETSVGYILNVSGTSGLDMIGRMFTDEMSTFRTFADTFAPSQVVRSTFEEYSTHSVTGELADALNTALRRGK